MKNPEDIQNSGEVIVSVSGGQKGVWVMIIGERQQIVRILKNAMKNNSVLRDIFRELLLNEFGKDQIPEDDQRLLESEG